MSAAERQQQRMSHWIRGRQGRSVGIPVSQTVLYVGYETEGSTLFETGSFLLN